MTMDEKLKAIIKKYQNEPSFDLDVDHMEESEPGEWVSSETLDDILTDLRALLLES